jgi:hypothetical protein
MKAVVSSDPGSEQRIAQAITAPDVGHGARLPALLTMTAWLEAHPFALVQARAASVSHGGGHAIRTTRERGRAW